MRDDAHHGGQAAYVAMKRSLVKSQRGICAYCEIEVTTAITDDAIDADKAKQRIEHFHPKSDLQHPPNWGLHWPNLWVVCMGGSSKPPSGEPIDGRHFLPPLKDNLSCDAFKDTQIVNHNVPLNPAGWIMAPNEIPAFPLLFKFSPNGNPEPNVENCAAFVPVRNSYANSATLVAKTIEHLNLSSPRLNRLRKIARAQIEKEIERVRNANPATPAKEVILQLARRLFSNSNSPWPEFFTLVRWRLGEPAEDHLRSVNFQG